MGQLSEDETHPHFELSTRMVACMAFLSAPDIDEAIML